MRTSFMLALAVLGATVLPAQAGPSFDFRINSGPVVVDIASPYGYAPPPPPVRYVAPPPSAWVWLPGYWAGHGHHRQWVEGRWERRHHGHHRQHRYHDHRPHWQPAPPVAPWGAPVWYGR